MLVFDKAYVEVKNKYILPLIDYSVPYRSLRNNNIKSILCNKFISVDDLGNKEYRLYFEKDILIKALLGDIELFFIRAVLQKEDVNCVSHSSISANWNIVTNYYYSFFYASLLLRICHRGNLFLDLEIKKQLEILISQVIGTPISLDSNLFYEIQSMNGNYAIKLSPSAANTHEIVWKKIDDLMDELILLSRSNSEESTVLKSIKNINNKLSNTYPSKLRNRVNYQPLYGIEYLDRKLYPLNCSYSWLKEIISFDISEIRENDNRIANVAIAYAKYIEIICNKLISEYFEIKGIENGILCKINEGRSEKIVISDLPFTYDM
ncbi:MAG: hypothetical protein AAGU39_10800 [Sedimentibacter saalensis]|uniref:hypothetical protein n=1 Tax=Sedimentibacter saalensis TaxID=130788 RepID=UPI0031592758